MWGGGKCDLGRVEKTDCVATERQAGVCDSDSDSDTREPSEMCSINRDQCSYIRVCLFQRNIL